MPWIYDEELDARPNCQKWLNEVHHDSPDYVYKREHKIADGKHWATRTPSSVYGMRSGSIEIPASELNGMSPQAIGNAVLSLRDEAHITDLLDQTEKWFRHWRRRFYDSSGGFKRLLVQFCMQIGGCYWYGPWRHDSEWLKQILQEMKTLQHAPEVREAYLALTEFIDAAYELLMTKKTKLTPIQEKARIAILGMRQGCAVCGLLDGRHTQSCPSRNEDLPQPSCET